MKRLIANIDENRVQIAAIEGETVTHTELRRLAVEALGLAAKQDGVDYLHALLDALTPYALSEQTEIVDFDAPTNYGKSLKQLIRHAIGIA